MLRAKPCRGPIHPEGPWGPYMPRAYLCPEPIHSEEPWGLIYAEGLSLPKAHLSRVTICAHPCPWPIPAHSPSIAKPHPSRGPKGANSC